MKKFALVDVKYIDCRFFQMVEGKFLDLEQKEYQNRDVYVYANIANNETDIEDSYVRYYPYSFDKLYCAEDYELLALGDYDDEIKKELIESDVYKEHFGTEV